MQLKRLYHWVIEKSGHPHAFKFLCFISFIESSVFPIPVYPLLLAMCIENPRRSIHYSVGAALSSVFGALLGYALGFWFWEVADDFFFKYVFSEQFFNAVADRYQRDTFIALFLGSLTPIPFKAFTITGGAMHVPLLPFFLGALCGRSPRFLIIGILFFFYGEKVRYWIEKHFTKFSLVVSAVAIVVIVTIKLIRP